MNWSDVYAEHGQAMRAAAIAAMKGPNTEILGQSADDIVSGVVREMMVRGGLPDIANVRGYLTTAVRNRVRDLIRRSRHEAPEAIGFDEKVGVDDIETPSDRAELARQALAGLDQVPERERYAIVERVMKHRPAKQVADELGVTPQRVSQLVNAGVGRLRKLPAFAELIPIDPLPPGKSTATDCDATGTRA